MTYFLAREHIFKCKLVMPFSLQNLLQDVGYHLLCVGVRIERDQEGTSEMQGLKITIWSLLSFLELSFHQTLKFWSLFAFASAEGSLPSWLLVLSYSLIQLFLNLYGLATDKKNEICSVLLLAWFLIWFFNRANIPHFGKPIRYFKHSLALPTLGIIQEFLS